MRGAPDALTGGAWEPIYGIQTWVVPCRDCGVKTVTTRLWDRRMTPHKRREMKALGYARRGIGDLCHKCRMRRERKARSAAEKSRTRYVRAEILAEWQMFADPTLSTAENARRIAPRLGMKSLSLERAIQRANRTAA